MGGQTDKVVDDDTASTASFEEVGFGRVSKDNQALVVREASGNKPTVDILYVLKHVGMGGKVINSQESVTPFEDIHDYGKASNEPHTSVKPILEIVTKVSTKMPEYRPPGRVPRYRNHYDDDDSVSSGSEDDFNVKPARVTRTYMVIHSEHLINALRAVVAYYPNVDLLGDKVAIESPYRVIVHHREALKRYRSHQPGNHSSEYARLTAEHVDVLLEFIEQTVGQSIRKEQERHQRSVPVATFENYWMALKPGGVIYVRKNDLWEAHILSRVSQNLAPDGRNRQLQVVSWFLEFGRNRIRRTMDQTHIRSWSGEQAIRSLSVIPASLFPDDPEAMLEKQVKLGKFYWDLLQRPTYMEYDGLLVQSHPEAHERNMSRGPSGYMTGRVICDAAGYERLSMRAPENRHARPVSPPRHRSPPVRDHLPHFLPRCGCKECDVETDRADVSPLADFDNIKLEGSPAPANDIFYIACTKVIPGFLLGDRRWGHLNIEHLKPVVTDREAFKYLVLDDEIKMTVKALIGKFAAAESSKVSPWANDFVRNKGEGRIFLLHGAPGVGKTCTAECVAELTNRPLISLTSGDLSVDSDSVERNLSYFLELGRRFGALVLLDEADVYLERRRAKDIARNGLVSVFLRALEYYRGVLFLTTNRVQAFDAAFTSRIHVALHYKNLTDADRDRIWANNFERLDRDSNGRVRVAVATREYAYGSREVRTLRWNGREIRNALQTALALAESDAAEEGNQRVCIAEKHLRAVVKMSRGFKDYLRSGNVYDGDSEEAIDSDGEEGETFSD
ncbi:ATPase [Colletotrichum falcatum]|nr:ATPase [Colletotrichum falcatum]